MTSGCICCTMRSDLAETLRGLLARRDGGEIPPFRRVLIETTGLADPAPIVQLLLNNPMLNRFVRLDAIATTVDAVHGTAQLDEEPEPAKQAAIADRLLLTKTDLANAAEIVRLCERLRGLNLGARLHTVLHGEIDPEKLFGAGLFDPAGKPPDVRAWINEPAYDGAAGSHQHHHGDGVHDAPRARLLPLLRRAARMGRAVGVARPASPLAWRASSPGQGDPQPCGGSGAGRDPRRPPRVPPARAAPGLARRRPALPDRLHHARPRPRGSRCAKRCRRLRRRAEPYSRSSRTPRSTFTVPGSAA